MFIVKVKPDISKDNQPLSYLVEKCVIEEKNDTLEAHLINIKAFSILQERIDTHERTKRIAIVKLNFQTTLFEDKLLITFTGNIRHSLFFLVEINSISPEAYNEAISTLDKISYKLPHKKVEITPNAKKLSSIDEEEKQQSSSLTTTDQAYTNSSQLLFSHAKDESKTSHTSIFCPPTCSI